MIAEPDGSEMSKCLKAKVDVNLGLWIPCSKADSANGLSREIRVDTIPSRY